MNLYYAAQFLDWAFFCPWSFDVKSKEVVKNELHCKQFANSGSMVIDDGNGLNDIKAGICSNAEKNMALSVHITD